MQSSVDGGRSKGSLKGMSGASTELQVRPVRVASGSNDSGGGGVFRTIFGGGRSKVEEAQAELEKRMDIANLVEEGMPVLKTTSGLRKRVGAREGDGGSGEEGMAGGGLGQGLEDDYGGGRDRKESKGGDDGGDDSEELDDGKAKGGGKSGPHMKVIRILMKAKNSFISGVKHVASDVLNNKDDDDFLEDVVLANGENYGEDTFHDVKR